MDNNNNGAKDAYKSARQDDNPNHSAGHPSKRWKGDMDNEKFMKYASSQNHRQQNQNTMNSNKK